jgi:hypothetical protein
MITNQDFEIPEGDTQSIAIPLFDRAGSPFTLPGGAVVYWWASRSQHDGVAALIKKQTPTTIVLAQVGEGTTVNIAFAAADTTGKAWQNFYHEGYLVQLDGVKLRLFSGTMKVTKTLVSV